MAIPGATVTYDTTWGTWINTGNVNDTNDISYATGNLLVIGDAERTTWITVSDFSAFLGTTAQDLIIIGKYVLEILAEGPDSVITPLLEYSTNGGSTWTTLANITPTSITGVNPAQLQIRAKLTITEIPPGSTEANLHVYFLEVVGDTAPPASMMGFM